MFLFIFSFYHFVLIVCLSRKFFCLYSIHKYCKFCFFNKLCVLPYSKNFIFKFFFIYFLFYYSFIADESFSCGKWHCLYFFCSCKTFSNDTERSSHSRIIFFSLYFCYCVLWIKKSNNCKENKKKTKQIDWFFQKMFKSIFLFCFLSAHNLKCVFVCSYFV